MKSLSLTKQKILLLLLAGVALGLSYTPNRQGKIIKSFSKEWKNIEQRRINEEIRELYKSKLVEAQQNKDGSTTLVLTDKGKMKTLTYHFATMKISKAQWDGQWRVVVFDIPEKIRHGRDALRQKLRELGFYELQKSVFVIPYSCEQEIEFAIEYFGLKKYARYGVLSHIDNDFHLRKIFNLA